MDNPQATMTPNTSAHHHCCHLTWWSTRTRQQSQQHLILPPVRSQQVTLCMRRARPEPHAYQHSPATLCFLGRLGFAAALRSLKQQHQPKSPSCRALHSHTVKVQCTGITYMPSLLYWKIACEITTPSFWQTTTSHSQTSHLSNPATPHAGMSQNTPATPNCTTQNTHLQYLSALPNSQTAKP